VYRLTIKFIHQEDGLISVEHDIANVHGVETNRGFLYVTDTDVDYHVYNMTEIRSYSVVKVPEELL